MKAKGLLSQMLSLPEDWDYTLAGLSHINREEHEHDPHRRMEQKKAWRIYPAAAGRDEKGKARLLSVCHPEELGCVGKSNTGQTDVGKSDNG